MMAEVTLIYPYFNPPNDKSIFRFPPLGLGYIASYLRAHGKSVEIIERTLLKFFIESTDVLLKLLK